MAAPTGSSSAPTLLDRAVGWVLLLSGLTMLGMATVTPLWLEHRQLRWQRDVMAQQAQALAEQADRYRAFEEALENDEPVLLARLAYQQLRLKPVGAIAVPAYPGALPLEMPDPRQQHVLTADRHAPPEPQPLKALAADGSIESWLHEPVPRVGVDVMPPPEIDSYLVRMASGFRQAALLLVGVICLASGLLLGHGAPAAEAADGDEQGW